MTLTDPRYVLHLLAVAVVTATICAALIARLLPVLKRHALARPNARSSHAMPTPQGAGIAVIAATLLVAGTFATLTNFAIPALLIGASLFLALVGFVDDIRPIPVLPRLLLQATAVAVLLLVIPADMRIVQACPLWLERSLLLIAGLWFVNLVNFMDGLDLMTVAETLPITAAMMLLGWLGEFPATSTAIAAALCGAMLGFAPFNRPVARIFLGDVGSLPIGLLLGWCLLDLALRQHFAAALLLPLYYLADASATLLRRMARREPFWVAHRTHFYQRATDNGLTVSRIVSEVFALNIFLAILAIASVEFESAITSVLSLLAGATAVTLLLYRFSRSHSSLTGRGQLLP
jgi:UDP-N-acetylmuramyl pentapeptide phosphotransferase/UDP-N-acetylglucosamine-1-phosphate transferase